MITYFYFIFILATSMQSGYNKYLTRIVYVATAGN
jgi:hypothetical protein